MDPRAEVSSVALFYYFVFFDEKVSLFATLKTWNVLKKKSAPWGPRFVAATHHGYTRYQRTAHPRIPIPEGLTQQVSIPENIDMGPWREFRKRVGQDEFLAVLWTQVLQIPEVEVMAALKISQGTLKYRLSRGLRQLGEMSLGSRL
jgi:hypothetical protein